MQRRVLSFLGFWEAWLLFSWADARVSRVVLIVRISLSRSFISASSAPEAPPAEKTTILLGGCIVVVFGTEVLRGRFEKLLKEKGCEKQSM